MKPKVVLTQPVHREVVDLLSPHASLILNETGETMDRREILSRSRDARAIMVFMTDSIDASFLAECPDLRIVAGALKGYDNFDVEACTRSGIWFTIVPDLLTIPTAELTVALMLGVSRHLLPGDRWVRSGRFRGWRPQLYGMGISGRTIGITGMGAVGRTIARRLSGFDCRVIYHDVKPLPKAMERGINATRSSFEDLLSSSDFLVPMLPLTNGTYHLINREAIKKMKKGSYLVNTGRGSVIDESAVLEALESGHLAGYAADVFEMEDWALPDKPKAVPEGLLGAAHNTLFTPHLGSAVDDIRRDIELQAAVNILQALKGERPQGAVNGPFR